VRREHSPRESGAQARGKPRVVQGNLASPRLKKLTFYRWERTNGAQAADVFCAENILSKKHAGRLPKVFFEQCDFIGRR